jgi:Vta1 like
LTAMTSPPTDDEVMKCVSPWLLRAEELAASGDARVAYYLREHAMQEGLRLGGAAAQTLPRTKAALRALMTLLETDRPKAGLQGKEADGAHILALANTVFDRADARVRTYIHTHAVRDIPRACPPPKWRLISRFFLSLTGPWGRAHCGHSARLRRCRALLRACTRLRATGGEHRRKAAVRSLARKRLVRPTVRYRSLLQAAGVATTAATAGSTGAAAHV